MLSCCAACCSRAGAHLDDCVVEGVGAQTRADCHLLQLGADVEVQWSQHAAARTRCGVRQLGVQLAVGIPVVGVLEFVLVGSMSIHVDPVPIVITPRDPLPESGTISRM